MTNYVYDLVMLLPSNMFKPSGKFPTDRSNLELLSWILFVICVSYFSLSYGLVCSLQVWSSGSGKGLTSRLFCA